MLRVAVPNKGSLSEAALEILREAGYPGRGDSKSLTVADPVNDIEFYFLRPKDIPVYVGNGHLDLGITGRDLAADSLAPVDEVLTLGFGASTFRYAAPAGEEWTVEALEGKRIATSYPNLVREDLKARGINAEVLRLDGAVEISIRLGVADAIADVVSTGRTLRKQGLAPFGESLCDSEAVVVARRGNPADAGERESLADGERSGEAAQRVFLRRLTGILHAKNYMMLDYNISRANLEEATRVTPGLSGPTVSPLAHEDWVAVRAMVPRKTANPIMDRLASLGAEAILASDIRIARI